MESTLSSITVGFFFDDVLKIMEIPKDITFLQLQFPTSIPCQHLQITDLYRLLFITCSSWHIFSSSHSLLQWSYRVRPDAARRPTLLTANISQLEQFAPRLSHKAVAKEHKKSESYQLTRSLRSAVLSHSSCSYVTCVGQGSSSLSHGSLFFLRLCWSLHAGVACALGKIPTHRRTAEDGTFFWSPAARRLLRYVLWRFRPVVSFLTLYVCSDCQIRPAGRTATVKAVSVVAVENGKLGYTVLLHHFKKEVFQSNIQLYWKL